MRDEHVKISSTEGYRRGLGPAHAGSHTVGGGDFNGSESRNCGMLLGEGRYFTGRVAC